MAGMKTSVTRFGGRSLARLIGYVASSSTIVFEPADLRKRLRATHPCIIASWHGQFMMLCQLHPGDITVSAMVARHGDAEFIAEAMRHFKTDLIRGAGAGDRKRDRGGAAALRAAVKALNDQSSLVMTADIPPGPARVAGIGIITIARMSGCPIVPVAAASSRFASFDTWSRMTVNLPYSKLAFVGGDPIHVPRDADAETLETLRKQLETQLNAATVRAYELAGADIKRATPLDHLAAISPPPPNAYLKIYATALSLLRPGVPLLLNRRERQGKEDAARRGERLGFAGRRRPVGKLIWVHAASVGETIAVLPLIDELLQADPSAHVLLTTGTTTSATLAARRLPERAFHQFVPLDVPQYCARFLDHWRPDLSIFTESDIWPNLVLAIAERAIPLALINARMSPRSMRRWRKNARIGRPLFSRFNVVLAQNSGVARTIKQLGAPNVIIAGNLKIDAPPPPVDPAALTALEAATEGRPILLAASTHPGEESLVATAHAEIAKSIPALLTIIVPRHPDRGQALAAEMAGRGLATERRSQTPLPSRNAQVYIADTIGELGTFYALSSVALIGGSLVEHGGQNPIEAIRHGAVVLTGPHKHNFHEIYDELLAAKGATEVKSADELAAVVKRLLSDPSEAAKLRTGAEAALGRLGGALAKTVAALKPFLTNAGP
ncbi:MAG: glycosyltransferase N-terminal domain-containing protein [Hyphomicrobium sp.]